MSKRILACAALLAAALSTPAFAQVDVADSWVRATVPQQKATGAFMTLTAPRGARLVEARSPVAGIVEIHEMAMVDNVMRMRQVPSLELPAGKAVRLAPGGYHLMLLDLRQPVADGQNVPITLVVEDADKKRSTIEVNAPARPLTAAAHKH